MIGFFRGNKANNVTMLSKDNYKSVTRITHTNKKYDPCSSTKHKGKSNKSKCVADDIAKMLRESRK